MSSDAERLNIILAVRDKELAAAIDRNTRKIDRFAGNTQRRLSRTSQSFDKLGRSAKAASGSMGRLTTMTGSQRFVLQNTAAQLGDISVQLESGTAASRVMAQQLPQILGGFGALGGVLGVVAPILGTVAAVGIPLAAMFAMTGSDAEEAAEKVKTFADKLAEAEGALGRAEAALVTASDGGLVQLEERYGEVTQKVRELAEALADIELRAAKVAIDAVLDEALGDDFRAAVDKVFGTVGAAVLNVGTDDAVAEAEQLRGMIRGLQAEVDTMRLANQAIPQAMVEDLAVLQEELAAVEGRVSEIGSLADEMLVSQETLASLDEMRARLKEARDAGDFYAMADAMSDIRNTLVQTGDAIDQGVIDKLAQAEDQARVMAEQLGQSKDVAVELGEVDISSGISPAVVEALKLANALGISLETARKIAALGPQGGEGGPRGGRGGDPRDFGGGFNDWRWRDADEFLENWKPPRTGRSGGRSGAVKTTEVRKYEAALKSVEEALARNQQFAASYEAALEALRAQFDAGEISAEDFAAGVARIERGFKATQTAAKQLQNAAANAFVSIVTNSGKASDAVSNLLAQLASMAARAAFMGLFGGSSFFSAVAPIFSSVPSFDGGGYTGSAPRTGGVDGKGGFWMIGHPQESVIDHTKGQGLSGGPASMTINVNVSGARGNKEISDMVETGLRRGLSDYDRTQLPTSVKRISRDARRVS